MDYEIVKWLHVLSSTLLFGTGIGSAYYMLVTSLGARRSRDATAAAVVVGHVVTADWLFTATTIVFQPLSGWYLIERAGFPMHSSWIVWSLVLYVVAGMCWLPVVWIQLRMRDMARKAAAARAPLPPLYWTYLRRWVLLGVPAFFALVVIFYLMVAKPA